MWQKLLFFFKVYFFGSKYTKPQVFWCEECSGISLFWSKDETSERKCLQWTKQPITNQYQCIKWIDFYHERNCFFRKTYFYKEYHILSCCVKMWYYTEIWNNFGEIGEKIICKRGTWSWYDMICEYSLFCCFLVWICTFFLNVMK